MLVFVEQKHIDNGAHNDGWWCPIALAAKEQYGYDFYIGTGPVYIEEIQEVSITGCNCGNCKAEGTRLDAVNLCRYELDSKGCSFVAAFDAGLPVKPCVVNLYQQPKHLPIREGWPEE